MDKTKIFLLAALILTSANVTYAQRANLKEQFIKNESVIYTINIRSFGSIDNNNDGIISPNRGDIKGTFLNAKNRLNDLKNEGINTIYLLPITKTGKLKALGNAGSLYAMDDFSQINPQLDDITNSKTVKEEAKEFVDYAHMLDMNVIVDLPSCGSYDLSLNKPDWFLKNEFNEDIVPSDWTDVRLFRVYKDDELYEPTLENFKKFVDMVQQLGFDGIRADVAAIKPYAFWKKITDYAKIKNPNFLFIAEASPDWSNPAASGVEHYATIAELLNAGFSGYYGSWSDFKSVRTKKEFDEKIEKNLKILRKNPNSAIMSSFATHDQQAPILRGKNYWRMILWLNATLPINAYFLDGFSTGDNFVYPYENKKAEFSYTDDELYFVHSGMFDIFNLSAAPKGKYPEFRKEYIKAIDFKKSHNSLIKPANYATLKTGNESVFGYTISNKKETIAVIGNLDENKRNSASVKISGLKNNNFKTINSKISPKIERNKLTTSLEPLEIQVYFIKSSR